MQFFNNKLKLNEQGRSTLPFLLKAYPKGLYCENFTNTPTTEVSRIKKLLEEYEQLSPQNKKLHIQRITPMLNLAYQCCNNRVEKAAVLTPHVPPSP